MHDPLHAFQAAARAYALAVHPHAIPKRVVIYDADGGRIVEVRLHNGCGATTPPEFAALASDVKAGWDFSRKVPVFDGKHLPEIAGRSLAVLRVLAEAPGPVDVDGLRAAWPDYAPAENSIRNQVAELRKLLKRLWPDWSGDPLPASGSGYSLEIR